jgi:hypothetical protein
MAKKKLTKADLEAREQMLVTAKLLRDLAEKAQAELDRRGSASGPESAATR